MSLCAVISTLVVLIDGVFVGQIDTSKLALLGEVYAMNCAVYGLRAREKVKLKEAEKVI